MKKKAVKKLITNIIFAVMIFAMLLFTVLPLFY
jgi:hypothetical protein